MTEKTENKLPAWLELTSAGARITLSKPKEQDGVQVDKLLLRSPTVGEYRKADKAAGGDPAEREALLFACLCDISVQDLEKLELLDYRRLQEGYFRLVPLDGGDA